MGKLKLESGRDSLSTVVEEAENLSAEWLRRSVQLPYYTDGEPEAWRGEVTLFP